ncbi:MAG TPA: cupredoxin domain-containing protein [Candidatus Binatus sp.]|uniref:cupredoxin domain-containing protein n=1 Tax=Candidatus Binatus sp. TaxID=2811406 RepID=UPI002B4720A2|nr:cupredoxin domain-containing protein [Candidatus Binatus sp.]HKN12205.1 cupredoxin domain-containing protein [Candidatus Binatus sp.]
MTKVMLKTMGAIAAVAVSMLLGANRIAMAQGAAPSAAAAPAPAMEEPGTRSFTLVSVEVDDAKIWLPSVIAVEQGDKVKLTLKNLVPGAVNQHGFTIPAYNITEVVTRGEPKTITFVADKAGVFPFSCQLHPAHIGGSLIVEPKK